MIKKSYPASFERLWNGFDTEYGEKGSKKAAFEVFRVKEINSEDVDFILERYRQQLASKKQQRANGAFWCSFQHVERYLRNERWEDEISIGIGRERESKSDYHDRKAREYLESFNRGYDESLESLVGDEAGDRTNRLN